MQFNPNERIHQPFALNGSKSEFANTGKAPLSSRNYPTGTFGADLLQTVRTRTNDTDSEEPHYRSQNPIRGLIDDIELNSLINAESTETKSVGVADKQGSRDQLLLKCREVIEVLNREVEEERAQKRQLQHEHGQLQQYIADL